MGRKRKTDKAVKILHDRYIGDDAKRKVSLEEERLSAQVARTIFRMRIDAGLTQIQLARLIGTTQSVISRLEDADYEGHSLSMVNRIAAALDRKLKLEVMGKGKRRKVQGKA